MFYPKVGMQIHYTRPLLPFVEGQDDTLSVGGRLVSPVTSKIELRLRELHWDIVTFFNFFSSEREMLEYRFDPIAYTADEFSFFLDVGNLGRLARELLIRFVPGEVLLWEKKFVTVTELWVGGHDESLTKHERKQLQRATREVRALPLLQKVFVIDEASLRSHAQRLGTRGAIREAGGLLHDRVSPECDYFVTDQKKAAEAASQAGAKQIIDTITLTVMLDRKD